MFETVEFGFYGTDREGRPIRISKSPTGDAKLIFDKFSMAEWLDLQIMFNERTERIIFPLCSKQKGKLVSSLISIVDMSNFKIGGIMDSKFKNANKRASLVYEQNYPCYMHKTYLINVPTVFYLAWNIFKWFMKKKVRNRIIIVTDKSLSILEKEVTDLENLPISIGGKNPIGIREYNNFWKEEILASFEEKRLDFK